MRAWIFGIVMASAALIVGCGDGGGSGGSGGNGGSGGGDGGSGGDTTVTTGDTTGGTTGETTSSTTNTLACGVIFDEREECQACMEEACCAELELCAPGTDCDELILCANECAEDDDACIQACIEAHQEGLADFQTIQGCYADNCELTVECSYPICESGLVVPDMVCGQCLSDNAECCTAFTACAEDATCLDCLDDPTTAGCDQNASYVSSDSCLSAGDKCGKSCTTGICDSGLTYPNFPACNWCLGQASANGGCCEETTACADDANCLACITGEQTGTPCDNDPLFMAFETCQATNCATDCGL